MSDRRIEAQIAILQERKRRDYAVVVKNARRTNEMCGLLIPDALEVYVANTTCTETHESGLSCRWIDWAFFVGGIFRVVLQNDLSYIGLTVGECTKLLFVKFLHEQNESVEKE